MSATVYALINTVRSIDPMKDVSDAEVCRAIGDACDVVAGKKLAGAHPTEGWDVQVCKEALAIILRSRGA